MWIRFATGVAVLVLALALGRGPVAGQDGEEAAERPPRAMLLFPVMDPERGRELFAAKGCVVCHAVNEVGGRDAAPLDFDPGRGPVDPFQVAADMWAHAAHMIPMQEEELGYQIELTADELADIVAFLASPAEQRKFSEKDIPPNIMKILERELEEEDEEDYGKD